MASRESLSLDDLLSMLHALGWRLALRSNTYSVDGVEHMLWLFTREATAIRGEAPSDHAALEKVLEQALDREPSEPPRTLYEDDGEYLSQRVYDAFVATFRDCGHMPSLSHFMDHVQSRWAENLRRALVGSSTFIYP